MPSGCVRARGEPHILAYGRCIASAPGGVPKTIKKSMKKHMLKRWPSESPKAPFWSPFCPQNGNFRGSGDFSEIDAPLKQNACFDPWSTIKMRVLRAQNSLRNLARFFSPNNTKMVPKWGPKRHPKTSQIEPWRPHGSPRGSSGRFAQPQAPFLLLF